MQLPDGCILGKALRNFRKKLECTIPEMAKRSGVSPNTIRSWEKGKLPNYQRLTQLVLPAYEIEDFDLLVDLCDFLSQQEDAERSTYNHAVFRHQNSKDYSVKDVGDYQYKYAKAAHDRGLRVRMDWLRIEANEKIRLEAHDGCEAVMVLEGQAIFTMEDKRDNKRQITLGPYDSVSFNSRIPHKFHCGGDGPVVMAVARPSAATVHGFSIKDHRGSRSG